MNSLIIEIVICEFLLRLQIQKKNTKKNQQQLTTTIFIDWKLSLRLNSPTIRPKQYPRLELVTKSYEYHKVTRMVYYFW